MYSYYVHAIGIVVGCFVTLASLSLAPIAAADIKDQPVDFCLQDFRGKEHRLSDYSDSRVVVLAFLGTECPLAKLYGPRLQAIAQDFGDDVTLLGINSNVQDSLTEIAAYARRHELSFPILKDVGNRFADAVKATRTPEVVVLGEQRRIRYRGRIDDQYGVGYIRNHPQQHDLRDAVKSLLAGAPIATPTTEPVGCLIGRARESVDDAPVTYSNQIARIFQRRCVECHREGDIAPFELTDYDEAAGWAEMIEEVVRERRMPPWHADPDHGQFVDDRALTTDEREQIFRWVADGAPEGDPNQLPTPRKFTSGWQLPREPDLVLNVSNEPFRVQAEGEVEYQWFSADPNFEHDRWLQAAEILPGNRAVVHHILAFSRPKGSGERGISERDGYLVAYVPGLRARPFPKGMAKLIPAGSEIVFQVHYTPIGSEQFDQSKIGLIFADETEITHIVQTSHAINTEFKIPPHADNFEVQHTTPAAPHDVLLLSMMPHMHLRGKSFRYDARLPDGTTETLLDVPHYDFNWQTSYHLLEPRTLSKGTKIHCVAHFDNSEDNLANPDPSAEVHWGDQTSDEMMLGYFDIARPIREDLSALNPFGREGANPRSAAESLISMLDKNDDGQLQRNEVERKHLPIFWLVDGDRNGTVTLDELANAIERRRERKQNRE